MIDEKRKQEAKRNFSQYLRDGLIKKEHHEAAERKYLENAELSLAVANEIAGGRTKAPLWVIVISYYSMFYAANAVLLHLGYRTGEKIAHKVTSDALIVLVLDKLTRELLEGYEAAREEALDIAAAKAEDVIANYDLEREKRSAFQYNMLEQTKEAKAKTSHKRATEFLFELRKLLN